jgi:hypothetical protein
LIRQDGANEEVEVIWNAKMAASKDYTKTNKDKASLDVIEEKHAVFYQQTAEFKSVSDNPRIIQFYEECDPSDLTVASKFWKLAKQL